MVKNKKMSKSGIAIIVLALLLVLSMVMGLTGAWFTDQKSTSQEKTVNFGTIKLNYTGAEDDAAYTMANLPVSQSAKMMPGHAIEVASAQIVNLSDVKALMTYTLGDFTVTITGENSYSKTLHFTGEGETIFDYFDVYASGSETALDPENLRGFQWGAVNADVFAAGNKVKSLDSNGQWVASQGSSKYLNGDVYLVDAAANSHGTDLFIASELKLVAKTSISNQSSAALYVPNGAQMVVSYNITIKAIQADHVTVDAAAEALGVSVGQGE